jgi:L-threonylcarbamoyladenylate synthase
MPVSRGKGDAAEIARAAAAVAAGGVIAYPTETYYALGADPHQAAALEEVLRLKGRDAEGKPLLLLIADLSAVEEWAAPPPPAFTRLAASFWPGPLTLILPAAPTAPAPIVGPGGGVALRLTSHPLARRLIVACGGALTGTSANRGGRPPARRAAEVRCAFGDALAAVVDGGETPGGPPSTLLDLTVSPPVVARAGAVPASAIATVLAKT